MSRYAFRACIGLIWALAWGACQALTAQQILTPNCRADLAKCAQQPALQYYLGGIFDALAYVNKDLQGGTKLYCIDEAGLFDHEKVLRYIADRPPSMQAHNTTASVVRYLREFGGCSLTE